MVKVEGRELLLIYGGYHQDEPGINSHIFLFDIPTNTFSRLGCERGELWGRYCHSMVYRGGSLLIFGGVGDQGYHSQMLDIRLSGF
jgi:hypothetical protein